MAEEEKKAAVERKPRGRKPKTAEAVDAAAVAEESKPKRTTRARKVKEVKSAEVVPVTEESKPKRTTRARKPKIEEVAETAPVAEESKPKRTTRARKMEEGLEMLESGEESTPKRTTRGRKPKTAGAEAHEQKRTTRGRQSQTGDAGEAATPDAVEMTLSKSTEVQTTEVAAVPENSEAEAAADGRTVAAVAEPAQDRAAVSEALAKEATQAATETLADDTKGRAAEPGSLAEQAERIRVRRAKAYAGRSSAATTGQGARMERDSDAAATDAVPTAHDGETARTEVVEKTDELDNETQKAPSGNPCGGILEVMPDGFGFTRSDNFMPGDSDVYVNPAIIKRYRLKTGDVIHGLSRAKNPNERYAALSYIETVNGKPLSDMFRRRSFESLTPIFPNQRIRLEVPGERTSTSLRILDLLAPIGKGQRGMIVSPPKAGKTTLLKQVAKAIVKNEPKMHLLILLIDERPEEVTDMKEEVEGGLVTVIYSTFDEVPEHHKRVAEMTIERAKRLVEQGEDVTILLDSITRLARAYNLVVPASGRTLSGGLDPAALHMPKRFFGAARNMREGGSLTILSTALVETGSRMDDVIYEEFKGTGNMELVLNRELQERRIFPAIDIVKSGTRRDDLLLSELEQRAVDIIHKRVSDEKASSAEEVIQLFERTSSNEEVCQFVVNGKPIPSTGARMNSGIRSNPGTKTNGNPDSSTQKTGVKPGSNPNSRLAIKINR
ncbi:MAG: transcription termination factor Rho [Oribacterium sp.]|nr:transcription termination factor Rho [Oribacterium sp.]